MPEYIVNVNVFKGANLIDLSRRLLGLDIGNEIRTGSGFTGTIQCDETIPGEQIERLRNLGYDITPWIEEV